ncbi:MAG: hypothetical protein AAF678_05230, partial [Pseudomonadota bacterium]
MRITRRSMLMGTASAAVVGASALPGQVTAGVIKVSANTADKPLLVRMVQVVYPHAQFPVSCYERTADAIMAAADGSAAQAVTFTSGMADLRNAGFEGMDDAAALAHMESIEDTPFFQMVRGTTVVTLYNDHEVWGILGYEGASFDQGGYIDRGFNDLDWLP